jgi:hypothetical protein
VVHMDGDGISGCLEQYLSSVLAPHSNSNILYCMIAQFGNRYTGGCRHSPDFLPTRSQQMVCHWDEGLGCSGDYVDK